MENEGLTLERRIRAIEDRLEIYNLIAGHPPSADTGNAPYAEAVFTADAVFDRGPDLSGAVGNLQSASHQAAIAGGLAHFTSLPHVTINGDTAVVVSYLQILTPRKSGEIVEVPNHGGSRGYHIHRVVTNRWELVRTPRGGRSNAALCGSWTAPSRRVSSCAGSCRLGRFTGSKRQLPLIPARAGIQSHHSAAKCPGSPLSRGRAEVPAAAIATGIPPLQ